VATCLIRGLLDFWDQDFVGGIYHVPDRAGANLFTFTIAAVQRATDALPSG